MSEASLWCLAVGLLCLFRRFNETSSPSVDDAPNGTHPHPALRMRMVMNRIEQILALPGNADRWPGGSTRR